MAKLSKGILGPISGALGPIVGATWKGVPYVRLRPVKKPKSKQKRTAAQRANQSRFAFIQKWFVPFYSFITVGFRNHASDRTEINAAFSANYKTAFSGEYSDIVVDYSKILLSKGNLPGLHLPGLSWMGTDTIELTWLKNPNIDVAFDDQIMLVLYCPELHKVDGFIGGVKRNAMYCSFKFNEYMIGKALEVYVSVTSFDRRRISESMYLGRMEV